MITAFRASLLFVAVACAPLLAPRSVLATSIAPQNLVDLVSHSERILVGEVIGLDDGIDQSGMPYTTVTVRVHDSIAGDSEPELIFRQFGLLEPRTMPDGSTNLQVTPPGWPRFEVGEQVLLFLHAAAQRTGLQTTVGLMQGKFTITEDQIVNGADNANLFRGVEFDARSLTGSERAMVARRSGPLPAGAFVDLVRKVVREDWIARGRMVRTP